MCDLLLLVLWYFWTILGQWCAWMHGWSWVQRGKHGSVRQLHKQSNIMHLERLDFACSSLRTFLCFCAASVWCPGCLRYLRRPFPWNRGRSPWTSTLESIVPITAFSSCICDHDFSAVYLPDYFSMEGTELFCWSLWTVRFHGAILKVSERTTKDPGNSVLVCVGGALLHSNWNPLGLNQEYRSIVRCQCGLQSANLHSANVFGYVVCLMRSCFAKDVNPFCHFSNFMFRRLSALRAFR